MEMEAENFKRFLKREGLGKMIYYIEFVTLCDNIFKCNEVNDQIFFLKSVLVFLEKPPFGHNLPARSQIKRHKLYWLCKTLKTSDIPVIIQLLKEMYQYIGTKLNEKFTIFVKNKVT